MCAFQMAASDNLFINYMSRVHREEVRTISNFIINCTKNLPLSSFCCLCVQFYGCVVTLFHMSSFTVMRNFIFLSYILYAIIQVHKCCIKFQCDLNSHTKLLPNHIKLKQRCWGCFTHVYVVGFFQDFAFILKGLTRLLNNPLIQTYLPGSCKRIQFHQELLVLFWKMCDINKVGSWFKYNELICTLKKHDLTLWSYYPLCDRDLLRICRGIILAILKKAIKQNFDFDTLFFLLILDDNRGLLQSVSFCVSFRLSVQSEHLLTLISPELHQLGSNLAGKYVMMQNYVFILIPFVSANLKIYYYYFCVYLQKFMFYVLKSSDVLDILVPILYYLNDARADQCKEPAYCLLFKHLIDRLII